MKNLDELINREDPGINLIRKWSEDENANQSFFLNKDENVARKSILHYQVTTRSILGAVLYETGGIIIDSGWLRLLGSSYDEKNRSLISWNKYENIKGEKNYAMVGDDVIGGIFAINSGGIAENSIGNIFYNSPDSDDWVDLDVGYSDFVHWCLLGNIEEFYEKFRWSGWRQEIEKIDMLEGVSFFPFLWTKEGNVHESSRRIVLFKEIWSLKRDLLGI